MTREPPKSRKETTMTKDHTDRGLSREHEPLRGTIKTIKRAEGYGFVTHVATGEDYFFHRSQVVDSKVPFEALKLDQEVEFTPAEGPKGSRAMDVRAV